MFGDRNDHQGSGFFDRLVIDGKNTNARVRHRRSSPTLSATFASIKKNIELVLNSRQGCCLSAPNLGLSDFNDASAGSVDMLLSISKDIKETIEKFETRVSVNEVEYVPSDIDPMHISFRVRCSIKIKDASEMAELELLLDNANRKFAVQ